METYLQQNFSDVKSKNSSEEALQRWRKLCGVFKNPKRTLRFTANLAKRSEAEAIRKSNQEKLRVAVMCSKAGLQFIQGLQVEINADELAATVEGQDVKKLKVHVGTAGVQNFCDVESKNSSEESLQPWRKLCSIVKNLKTKFPFMSEAEAVRESNQAPPPYIIYVQIVLSTLGSWLFATVIQGLLSAVTAQVVQWIVQYFVDGNDGGGDKVEIRLVTVVIGRDRDRDCHCT